MRSTSQLQKTLKAASQFFKNKKGQVVIWQSPNLPLWVWIVCTGLCLAIKTGALHNGLSSLGQAAITIWAYLEVRTGDSPFRRVLGGIILVFVIYGFFAT